MAMYVIKTLTNGWLTTYIYFSSDKLLLVESMSPQSILNRIISKNITQKINYIGKVPRVNCMANFERVVIPHCVIGLVRHHAASNVRGGVISYANSRANGGKDDVNGTRPARSKKGPKRVTLQVVLQRVILVTTKNARKSCAS